MHYYCNCSKCRDEWTGRRGYNIGDDDPAPTKKSKSSKRYCNRAKQPKTPHDFTKKIEYYGTGRVWDSETHKFEWKKTLMTGYVCSRCGKPQRYYW